jgi:hypothetical protein
VSKFNGRIQRLERQTEDAKMDLVCPVCGWEIRVFGDPPLDLIVYQWGEGVDDEIHGRPPHSSLVEFTTHEQDSGEFFEKRSGLPLFSREVSGLNLGGPL